MGEAGKPRRTGSVMSTLRSGTPESRRGIARGTRYCRLRLAVPESERLLDEAFRRGESIGRSTTRLIELLDDYGAAALQSAIQLALERDTPRVSSVEWLLQQRRRSQQYRVRPVELDRRPDLADLHVQPHDSDIYDHLSDDDED
jgi:hypothetical protein